MSACEYLPSASDPLPSRHRHKPSRTTVILEKQPTSSISRHPFVRPSRTSFTRLSATSCILDPPNDHSSDDKPSLDVGSHYQSSSGEASADMEHHFRQGKVTLPPLSSLTTSLDLDSRREASYGNDRKPNHQSPLMLSHDLAQRDLGRHDYHRVPSDTTTHGERRWSMDRGDPREQHRTGAPHSPSLRSRHSPPTSAVSSASRHQPPTSKESPRLIMPPLRGIAESTRPRSNSSPHRNRLPYPTQRPSLADSSEADRLLESLLYVQDINRRLGLPTGGPPSPSIFRSSIAIELLRNKVFDELDNMARFSRSRAEAIAHDLGFGTYFMPSRATQIADASRETAGHSSRMPPHAISSGQAGHPAWPPNASPEGTNASIGQLSLEERTHQEFEHRRHGETIDYDYRDTRSMHADAAHGSVSRAISLDQHRSIPSQHRHAHPFVQGATEPPSFEAEGRMMYDHSMHPSYVSTAPLPPIYPAESRHQQQMDLLDRRRLAGKGMKRVRKRKNEHHQECLGCQAKETPEWRKGPMGPRTLCNACGLLYAKLTKRKQQEAEAAARASGKSAEEIVREREESPGAKQASLEALRAELNLANGMRNRPTSSSASIGNSSLLNAPHSTIASMHPSRLHEGMHRDPAHGHPWSARLPDDSHPFAYQSPSQQAMMRSASRSSSVGHIEIFDQLAGRPFQSSSAPSGGFHVRSTPVRAHTGGASPVSRPPALQAGRQRSHTLQSSSAATSYTRPYHDRSVSPATSTSQAYGPSSHGSQRRPHPYL